MSISKHIQLKYRPITWEQCHWSATTVTTGAEEFDSGKRRIKFRAWLGDAKYIHASITIEVPSKDDPRGGEVLNDTIISHLLHRINKKLSKYTQVTEQYINEITYKIV